MDITKIKKDFITSVQFNKLKNKIYCKHLIEDLQNGYFY